MVRPATRPDSGRRRTAHLNGTQPPAPKAAAQPPKVPPVPESVLADEYLGWLVAAWPALMASAHAATDLVKTRTRLVVAEVRLAARELLEWAEDAEAEVNGGTDQDYALRSLGLDLDKLRLIVTEAEAVVTAVMAGRVEVPLLNHTPERSTT